MWSEHGGCCRAWWVRSATRPGPPAGLLRYGGHQHVRQLGGLLARVAEGELCVLMAGDCAEDPAESSVADVAPKAEMLDVLGDIMRVGAGQTFR